MRVTRWAAIVLLAFLGVSACVGAAPMLLFPNGGGILPMSLLEHTPFDSFVIPGILLLTANGLLALAALWMVVMRKKHFGLWTGGQGCVLLGWLVIECVLLRTVVWLHYFYGAIAAGLILAGWMLWRSAEKVAEPMPAERHG